MKINKKGAISLILIIIFVILIGLGGYAYYKGNKANPNTSLTQKLTGGLTNVIKNVTPKAKAKELNYKFNFNANFEAKENGKEVSSGKLEIKNGEVITLEKSLKERLKIEEISGNLKEDGKEEKFLFKNLDFIGDNEITYFFIGEGSEKFINFYKKIAEQNQMLTIETINSIEKILKNDKYVKIDNSKPILRVLGDLSKNDLIKNLAIGLVTSNPKAYYEKTGVNKELKKVLISDSLINYLFKKGAYNEETKKTFLSLNTQICKDFSPIVVNIAKEFSQEGENIDLNTTELEQKCIDSLNQVNSALTLFAQIYTEGDTEKGNFKLVLMSGNFVKIEKNYKNHILDTYEIDVHTPNDMLILNISGNKEKVKSSLLKLNIDENGVKISGEIKNGNGKIDVNGNPSGMAEIKGNINFSNYKPSYDLTINSQIAKSEFVAKGDYKAGNIYLKQEEKEIFKLDYAKDNCNLEIDSPELKLKANYKNKVFDLNAEGKNDFKLNAHCEKEKINFDFNGKDYNGTIEAKFNYENGKLDGLFKAPDADLDLKGEFKNIKEFNIEINENIEKTNIKAENKKVSENENKFNLIVSQEEKEEFNLDISRITGEKDGYKTCSLKGKALINKGEKEINFNINSNYKEGLAKFEIPKNAEEINVKLQEISTLPDFNSYERLKEMGISPDKIFIGGVIIGGISGGAVANYSTQIEKARDAKRISDLNTMRSSIEMIYQDEGEYPSEDELEEKIKIYISKIPKDPLEGQIKNGCEFGYKYEVLASKDGIEKQVYKLSTCLENKNELAKNDGGTDDKRYEIGNFK